MKVCGYSYDVKLAQALVPNVTTGTASKTGAHSHTVPGYTIDMPQGLYFIESGGKYKLKLDAPASILGLSSKVIKVLKVLVIRKSLFLE